LVSYALGNVQWPESCEACRSQPSGRSLWSDGFLDLEVFQFSPDVPNDIWRENLFGAGVKKDARNESAE
jgi:hypothetical protein